MLKASLFFIFRPRVVLRNSVFFEISYAKIFKYLLFIGLLRGVSEFTLNVFINKEQPLISDTIQSGFFIDWFLEMPLAFVLWNVITAYFLWAMRRTSAQLGAASGP